MWTQNKTKGDRANVEGGDEGSDSLSVGTFSQGLHQVPVFHEGHGHGSTVHRGCKGRDPEKRGDEDERPSSARSLSSASCQESSI